MAGSAAEPLGPGTFTRPPKPYSVTVSESGKIVVKQGDWLSKYSWAMYGDYTTLWPFVRPDPANEIGFITIEDKDLIYAGETLLHWPTYEAWLGRKGGKPAKKPVKEPTPLPPGKVESAAWQVADLGGIDGTYFAGSAGVVALAFREMSTGTTFYFALLRAGAGLGLDLGHFYEEVKEGLKTLGRMTFVKRVLTSSWVPVTCNFAFAAQDLDGLSARCYGWSYGVGAGGGRSYEKITAYSSRFDYCSFVFEGSEWFGIPAGSVKFTGGLLVRVW